jgi:hypothetical protein
MRGVGLDGSRRIDTYSPWGAETPSRKLSVILMEQAAEPVSPVQTAPISCDGGQTDPWNRA